MSDRPKKKVAFSQTTRMRHIPVLKSVSKAMIPVILLFGLYVQFHGDFGPGGGFQAGVIFAAGIILYGLMFGLDTCKRVFSPTVVEIGVALGVLIFGGTGVAGMLLGGNFLDYNVLDSHSAQHGQHLGILIIEFGVGLTVTATMTMIFYKFAGRWRR